MKECEHIWMVAQWKSTKASWYDSHGMGHKDWIFIDKKIAVEFRCSKCLLIKE